MSNWAFERLDSVDAKGSIAFGRGNIISKDDMAAFPGPYPIYSSSAQNKGKFGEYGKFMFDEELVTWSVDGGGALFYRDKHKYSVTNVCGYLRVKNASFDTRFVYYCLAEQHRHLSFDYTTKAHPSVIKKLYSLPDISKAHQEKIANILQTIDEAIEETEALIEKYSLVKAGMMHDLFTRGLTPDGKLRPPREAAPDLYKETPIGWIPKEWDYADIGMLKETLVDGPFGSNLKTEHYVTDPGVRVVRLQNIQSGKYNDADRAYVSAAHALALFRNKVVGNDILIAGLGEDRYPVARACLYPMELPPALNKADCFRLRCDSSKVINPFMMFFLNTPPARQQVRRYEQGVTRPRINLGNMNRIVAPKPDLGEQALICERLLKMDDLVAFETDNKSKLLTQKSGLMHDLLTGEVPVKIDDAEAAHV